MNLATLGGECDGMDARKGKMPLWRVNTEPLNMVSQPLAECCSRSSHASTGARGTGGAGKADRRRRDPAFTAEPGIRLAPSKRAVFMGVVVRLTPFLRMVRRLLASECVMHVVDRMAKISTLCPPAQLCAQTGRTMDSWAVVPTSCLFFW